MIDSYHAPIDLAEARERVQAAAKERCGRLGRGESAIARLSGKRFGDEKMITAQTGAVVADMVLWRWDDASLRALADRLPPGAALVFCEPTADLGWRRALHRMTKNIWRVSIRHNFEADVPARLRAAGLLVTTTDRFSTGPMGIRSYVWGQAEHLLPGAQPQG